MKEEISVAKPNINCLSCIYGDYRLNPNKMGAFKKWNLASFNKKKINNKKTN